MRRKFWHWRVKLLDTQYWSIGSDNESRQYILAMTSTKDPAKRMIKHRENSQRKQTPVYFLNKNNNEKVEVCANAFFSTLQVIKKFVCYTPEHTTQGFNKPDSRGRHNPKQKLMKSKKELLHILTHFLRYLITLAKMHKLYLAECQKGVDNPVSVPIYKDILHSQKIKIHKPRKDQCKICVKYARCNPEEKAHLEASQQIHISNNKVIDLKLAYKTRGKEEPGLLVFSFNLEAVLHTPCNKVSTVYYIRKLCT